MQIFCIFEQMKQILTLSISVFTIVFYCYSFPHLVKAFRDLIQTLSEWLKTK